MSEFGILIITHNSAGHIGPCLDRALMTGAPVLVVDNASQDGSLAEAQSRPLAQVVANGRNEGFAQAVNQGIELLGTPYVLLLNPDVRLETPLDALLEECAWPDVAAVTGCLVGKDDRPQTGFMVRRFPTPWSLAFEVLGINRIWPRNPVNRRYRHLDLDAACAQDVQQPAAAFLLVKRSVWLGLGGFDEGFQPVWFEDVDFCRRAVQAGHRIRYVPTVAARHAGGHSVSKMPRQQGRVSWYSNLLRYGSKHFDTPAFRMVCVAVMAGSLLRGLGGLVYGKSRGRLLRTYWQVTRLAARALVRGKCREGLPVAVPVR